jgi:hypothetical protein
VSCPQVTDGGPASRHGFMCSRGQPRKGDPPAWGLGAGLTTPRRKK